MKACFMASMAIAISDTVRIPMMIPSVVSVERSLLARMAWAEMARPSVNSTTSLMASGSGQIGPLDRLVRRNQPVADAHDAPCLPRDFLLVRHENDRVALAGEIFEEGHDLQS